MCALQVERAGGRGARAGVADVSVRVGAPPAPAWAHGAARAASTGAEAARRRRELARREGKSASHCHTIKFTEYSLYSCVLDGNLHDTLSSRKFYQEEMMFQWAGFTTLLETWGFVIVEDGLLN